MEVPVVKWIKRLRQGEYSMAKTFWVFIFCISLGLTPIFAFLFYSIFEPASVNLKILFYIIFLGCPFWAYFAIALEGLHNSSKKYTGPENFKFCVFIGTILLLCIPSLCISASVYLLLVLFIFYWSSSFNSSDYPSDREQISKVNKDLFVLLPPRGITYSVRINQTNIAIYVRSYLGFYKLKLTLVLPLPISQFLKFNQS